MAPPGAARGRSSSVADHGLAPDGRAAARVRIAVLGGDAGPEGVAAAPGGGVEAVAGRPGPVRAGSPGAKELPAAIASDLEADLARGAGRRRDAGDEAQAVAVSEAMAGAQAQGRLGAALELEEALDRVLLPGPVGDPHLAARPRGQLGGERPVGRGERSRYDALDLVVEFDPRGHADPCP